MPQLIYLVAHGATLEALQQALQQDYPIEPVASPQALERRLAQAGAAGESALLLLDRGCIERFGELQCQALTQAARQWQLPVLMVGDRADDACRLRALAIGCDDYLGLPLLMPVLESKLRTHLRLQQLLRNADGHLQALDQVANELSEVQDAAILCLAAIARVRDYSTGNHILRTQHYVRALAEHLCHHPDFSPALDSDAVELLYKTAALHDIGKVAIPDAILQKPGRLSGEEFEVMKRHTLFGYQAMQTAETLMERGGEGRMGRFLEIGKQVTLSHHERWDGSGYPQGLAGEQIPVVARLMAVADSYDAICSRRPYKDAIGHREAAQRIRAGRGTHFDPRVVDAFVDLQDTFEHIAGVLERRFPSLTDLTLHSIDLLPVPAPPADGP